MIKPKVAETAVLLLLVCIAHVCAWIRPSKEAAVIFTDVKFDDLAAVHYLMPKYNQLYIVLNGIKNRTRGHTMLKRYLLEAGYTDEIIANKVVVLEGNQRTRGPKGEDVEVSHEAGFLQEETAITKTFQDWASTALDIDFDIYQMAQTHSDLLLSIPDTQRIFVINYHLIHGYNTEQSQYEDNDQQEAADKLVFANNLKEWFPNAVILATNNHFNFESPDVGQTTSAKYLDGRFPKFGLDYGKSDTFAFDQIDNYITKEKEKNYNEIVPPDFDKNKNGLKAAVKIALRAVPHDNAHAISEHLLQWWDKNTKPYRRLKTAFTQILKANKENFYLLEFCDAVHVAYAYRFESMNELIPIKFVPKHVTKPDVVFKPCVQGDADAFSFRPESITQESVLETIDQAFPPLQASAV